MTEARRISLTNDPQSYPQECLDILIFLIKDTELGELTRMEFHNIK
jgi:hypothetical protein